MIIYMIILCVLDHLRGCGLRRDKIYCVLLLKSIVFFGVIYKKKKKMFTIILSNAQYNNRTLCITLFETSLQRRTTRVFTYVSERFFIVLFLN